MKTARLTIPEWAVCPLEYGDRSGITEREEALLDAFEAMLDAFAKQEGLKGYWFDWDDQHFFHWKNDLSDEGGMCVSCTVHWED